MTASSANRGWFVHTRPNPQARLRLFCFPYAGGGASVFRLWANEMPAQVEVLAIQPPGRETRLSEKAFTRMAPYVQNIAREIAPYTDKPFAFFGHSLGARVSFELARSLRRNAMPTPVQLFVSGNPAPHIPDPDPPIYHLPDSEFIQELRGYNGTPNEVLEHEELMELLLPLLRADFELHDTYTYTSDEPLDCPIFAFGGLRDPDVSQDDLTAWRKQTSNSFNLRMFPGDHFFLHNERTQLIRAVSQDMLVWLSRFPRG
ncbi:MAG: thioesterase [Chloroflexi bacterium AL-W]|nr:thioesterase [Chloroflexi bacterium AL-N1]NOK71323.1 thioesterase [Chloroflexi bacterium AL-N10]NOK78669.1 thioesterase [Chloroflexi bacterium AL-N5]NOK85965.1 thioesterase [Chloroflexi bacterium AL-W]NOK93048.1 thioesterase [Chloroflexi bacterium AL-N15]